MTRSPWVFGRATDVLVFGGTAVVALALLLLGPIHGDADSPRWSWIAAVLLVDVAHVWSTAFVVYLDPAEWKRRPGLYAGVPVAVFVGGIIVFALGGHALFWRLVAYLAVFHFIRQQYGWVMMYRGRAGETGGRWLDGAIIYAATLYPLIVWHTELPRPFAWMKQGDFIGGLPPITADIALVIYVIIALAYLGRAIAQRRANQTVSWGKHLVVATTAACWYVGIVATASDYAFTVTNVFIHGVPYLVLVFLYVRRAAGQPESRGGPSAQLLRGARWRPVIIFLATLWAIAFVEELVWDKAIWHDHGWLFGGGWDVGGAAAVLVPLLAVPQLTHYILDGALWRRRANPRLGRLL